MQTTLFGLFDTVGRKMGGSATFDINQRTVIFLSVFRLIHIPLFLLTAFQVGPDWLFTSNWFKLLNMATFAFSNGYVSTLCAVKAPSTVPFAMRSQVGAFIGTTITLGILLGSTLALMMGPILKQAPPNVPQ